MKKLITILILLALFVCLVACNTENGTPDKDTNIQLPTGDPDKNEPDKNEPDGSGNASENGGSNNSQTQETENFDDKYDHVYILTQTGAANLRSTPSFSEDAKSISLKNGTLLERTGLNVTWSRVKYEDKTYYISNKVIVEKDALDGFEAKSIKIKIKTNLLNVRYAPARTTDEPVCQLQKDQIVEVTAFNDDLGTQGWYKIKLGTEGLPEYAYISAHEDYSEIIEEKPEDDAPEGVETLSGKTPEEIYSSALAQLSGIDNYTYTTVQVMTMEVEGEAQQATQLVFTQKDGQDEYVVIQSQADPSVDMVAWYVDETLYAITSTQKFKASISYADYIARYAPEGSSSDGALMNIPTEWLIDTRFLYDTEAELYYIEFTVSGEEYLEYMSSTALDESVAGIDNIIYRAYFDHDASLCDITTEFVMTVEGIDVHVMSVTTVSDIGATEIIAPEEPDTFTDITGQI